MSTYAIGDVQGCYDDLNKLLDKIRFDDSADRLWFCGDLVNRGPKSLEVVRFVKNLGDIAVTVLGNHDLHLLAVAHDSEQHKREKDTLDPVIGADDRDELLDWLRSRPLLHHDQAQDYVLVHAGLPPQWHIQQAKKLAEEASEMLRSDQYGELIDHMYGDKPDKWSEKLDGWKRLRFIINCLTRIRYCDREGRLSMQDKGPPGSQEKGTFPWFTFEKRKSKNQKIIFGHWSTIYLGDIHDFRRYNVFPLDTGCLWGGSLTALRLEDETWFSVSSARPRIKKDINS